MALKPGQKKCIDTLDRPIVVAAGAGSGKTFTLTKRIVHALESGFADGIDRILAITFTNKAAGELKARLRSELRACGMFEEALKVDDAWVSTIHGMCARILRAHAVELDLDPAFAIGDANTLERFQSIAINTVLERAESRDESMEIDADALDRLFGEYPPRSAGMSGVSVESMLRELMERASSNRNGADAFRIVEAKVNIASLVYAVADAFDYLIEATASQKQNSAREEWMAAASEALSNARLQLESDEGLDACGALAALDAVPLPKKTGTADYKNIVADAIETYRMCVMELRLAAATPHLKTLVEMSRQALSVYRSLKRSAAVMDNNDLIVLAADAIDSCSEIARCYTDKFQLVMVDEFQDTDQAQVDMIKRVSGEGARLLCTVGDAQQSIYRFRGADVSVYRRHLEAIRANDPDDVIELPDNFRSHPDVLGFVDCIFGRSDMFGGEFMSLAPGRDETRVKHPFTAECPRIVVQCSSNEYRGASSADVRRVAARRIALTFAELAEKGHSAGEMAVLLGRMTYAADYAQALRDAGLACVISGGSVFSSTNEAKLVLEIARVLANPRNTQSLFNVLASPLFNLTAGDLLVLATRVGAPGAEGGADADPASVEPVSPCGQTAGGGDSAYAEAGIAGGGDSARGPEPGSARHRDLFAGLNALATGAATSNLDGFVSERLSCAVRVMSAAIRSCGLSTTSRIAMRMLVDSGWLTREQACGAEGLARAGNALKAIRMIRDVERSGAVGHAEAARRFAGLLELTKEAPGALSATGGDFVRIMTVHASKGLEFPIVAVAEFKDVSGSSSKLLATDLDGSIHLSLDLGNTVSKAEGSANLKSLPELYAAMTDGAADETELATAARNARGALELRSALHEYGRVGDEEEAKRLLYVALTRAKECLVVSITGKRTKANPHAVPSNSMGTLLKALSNDEGFGLGSALAEFGRPDPAFVEHVSVEACLAEDCAAPVAGNRGVEAMAIPADVRQPYSVRVPYAPAHQGIFSYSSISEASHGSRLVSDLASRFMVSVDNAADDAGMFSFGLGEGGADEPMADSRAWDATAARSAAVMDEDDGSWAYIGMPTSDEDRATDFGTAFHRLAQHGVVARRSVGEVPTMDEGRMQALARSCGLDDMQCHRLRSALERWFASGLCAKMFAFEDLRAEVPFFIPVGGVAGPGGEFLEGEIDLLALDERRCAYVVDYKTGGNAAEDSEKLAEKHVLQAACYALALLRQGVGEVEATFARVEQRLDADPGEPQCVRYRFEAADMPTLEQAIVGVRASAR